MSEPPSQEPYDWNQALAGDKKARKRAANASNLAASGQSQSPAKPKKRGLGVIGWLIVMTSIVILAGAGVLAWMSWSFQSQSQREASDQQGLVPISRDFSPNAPKAADVLFRIAGTSALGEKLMPDLVANWMRARGYGGVSASEEGRIITVKGSKAGKDARVLIVKGSATGGFDALINGRVEAVMSLRQILPAEADRLSALGDMTSAENEKVIGLTADLVLVNRANSINDINLDTLGRIFSGEVTQWSDVIQDGDGAINAKVLTANGDFQTSVVGRLLGDRELPETVDRLASEDDIADAVGRNTAAIGIAQQGSSNTKALSVNERNARTVGANPFDIATEAYAFTKRVNIYVGSSNTEPNARDFAAYAMTPAGQEIVARTGFTPLKLAPAKIVVPVGAPRDYQNFARDAQRMNFDLRFHQGANELDSRAQEDVKRFAAYVAQNQIDKRRIALLGFADNVGARATNMGLAQSRAESVGIAMEKAGVSPGIIRAYGDAMPVGANAEEQGRIRNRRVEVWLCAPPACPLVDLVSQASTGTREVPTGIRLGPPRPPAAGEEAPKG
jgi:phosphate transport system substrate-binding protein